MLTGSRPIFLPSKLSKHAMTRLYLKQLLRIYNLVKTKTAAKRMKTKLRNPSNVVRFIFYF